MTRRFAVIKKGDSHPIDIFLEAWYFITLTVKLSFKEPKRGKFSKNVRF